MQNPSLVVVPYRYKATKLYSEIPITGVGDFTVGRLLDTATRVNSNGNIEVVNANIPRLDYYTTGGVAGCPALLVEPSATNLAWHSQTWATGTSWTLTNTTTLTGTTGTLDPFGTNTSNAISPTAASGIHIVESNFFTLGSRVSYTSGTIYTQSGFFKQGTGSAGRYVQLTFGGKFSQNGYANFDLQAGAVVASGGTADTNRAASIENYGNGWYRCRLTATCTQDGLDQGIIPVLITSSGDTRVPSFAGTITDVLYGWGAQLETGSVPTSYIPTTTGSVTRNADLISLTGASGLIGQSEGTIYWEGSLGQIDKMFFSVGASANQRISLETNSNGTMQFAVFSSTAQCGIATSAAITVGQFYKVAVAYKQNDFVFYLNGVQVGTDVSGTIPTGLTQMQFSSPAVANISIQRCRTLALYNSRLDDADLMVLTSPTYYSNVRDMIWDTFVARTSTFSELPGCLQTRHNELITL